MGLLRWSLRNWEALVSEANPSEPGSEIKTRPRRGPRVLFTTTSGQKAMPDTPPPSLPSSHHAPSLPNSPLAKRPKIMSNETAVAAVAPISASPPLLIKKISPNATTPTRGSAFAAGYDLYASEAVTIPARGRKLVGTGLQMAVVEGCCKFWP